MSLIKRMMYFVVLASAFNSSQINVALSHECSFAEKSRLFVSGFVNTDDFLSSRRRYCYAEAIKDNLFNSFIVPFPRLKPEQREWLQREIDEYRIPFEDPIWLTSHHYQQVDAIDDHLKTILSLTKNEADFKFEKRIWLMLMREIIRRDTSSESKELASKLGIKLPSPYMTQNVLCREFPDDCDDFAEGQGRRIDYRYQRFFLEFQPVEILEHLINMDH